MHYTLPNGNIFTPWCDETYAIDLTKNIVPLIDTIFEEQNNTR